ncbi:splicing regulatory glutamine/lysine-rich protein 1 [Anastrepha ludens]|uniref:splicing regulatory glutamine/lysine-rich protein 1 n=1 Tax=Anastrepha ludens TaxID=28586 RepID=UPI0023B1D62F|nr:splicing regulatory glutamine/lysine-rich protein 1 [Anastrepha ludens]
MDQNRKTRKKSKIFFLLNVLLEAVAIVAVVYCTLFSDCVLGNEVGGAAFIFLLFIFSAFIPDLFYLMLSPKLHTLGIDPLGVMFNFLMGALCFLIGISLIMVMLFFCGNYTQFILVIAGALSVCSGVFHLMNAFMCHKRLPKSERYYKQRHCKGAKAQKPDKKEKKVRKKGVQEEVKKGDKKDGQKKSKKGDKKDSDKKGSDKKESAKKKGDKKGSDKKDSDKKKGDKKESAKKKRDKNEADKKAPAKKKGDKKGPDEKAAKKKGKTAKTDECAKKTGRK